MIKVVVELRDSSEHELMGTPGTSLMEVIRDGGDLTVFADCGGYCACATCQVFVDDAWIDKLPAPDPAENELLDTSPHRRPNSRLSCQVKLTEALSGLRVKVAPEE